MRSLGLLLVLALWGCGSVNFPTGGGGDGGGDDVDAGGGPDGPPLIGCSTNDDCLGGTPFCLLPDGVCVTCLSSDNCNDTSEPVCEEDGHFCRGCRANSECPSMVCSDLGACVDPSLVVYVRPDGLAESSCTQDLPCNSLFQAQNFWNTARPTLVIQGGTWGESLSSLFGGRIVGVDGATLKPLDPTSPPMIQTYGHLRVEGLNITGMRDQMVPAMACSNSGSLTVVDSQIHGNLGHGLETQGPCDITCVHSRFGGNGRSGMQLFGATRVTVEGCRFEHNTSNGLGGNPIFLDVINSVFWDNNNGPFGYGSAIRIEGAAATSGRLVFNTFHGNHTNAEGIIGCNGTPLTIENNIFTANVTNFGGPILQSCNGRVSTNMADVFLGGGNFQATAEYEDMSTGNFDLREGSPGIDQAQGHEDVVVDIVGRDRPQGTASDLGAHESH
jgi:hypothetical protein